MCFTFTVTSAYVCVSIARHWFLESYFELGCTNCAVGSGALPSPEQLKEKIATEDFCNVIISMYQWNWFNTLFTKTCCFDTEIIF